MKELKLTVEAGAHDRADCPVFACFPAPKGMKVKGATLAEAVTCKQVPCQVDLTASGVIGVTWILDRLPAGERRQYSLALYDRKPARSKSDPTPVTVKPVAEDQVEVKIGGEVTTNYWFNKDWARPFLHPVIGPYGSSVTRLYPMIEGVPYDREDHPHHKGIFVAWGNLEGTDNWSESKYGHGRVLTESLDALESGPVYGRIRAKNSWMQRINAKLGEEMRDIVFYNFPRQEMVMLDMQVTFIASYHNLHFLDTKEGGICAVRVRGSMDVDQGLGGMIENSYGGINEDEAWGKRAHWCDYSGPVEGQMVGVAVFDALSNPGSPTYWHVRNYGLMTANPFGAHDFVNKREDGSWLLRCGDQATFSYRIYVHKGRAGEARVAEKYHDFVNPPKVTIK